jgi:hypothetical protein
MRPQEELLEGLRMDIADALEERVRTLLPESRRPHYRLTVIGRLPGNDEADILVTDDSVAGIRSLMDRMVMRETA